MQQVKISQNIVHPTSMLSPSNQKLTQCFFTHQELEQMSQVNAIPSKQDIDERRIKIYSEAVQQKIIYPSSSEEKSTGKHNRSRSNRMGNPEVIKEEEDEEDQDNLSNLYFDGSNVDKLREIRSRIMQHK